jgi:hypothetical protein
MRAEGAALRRVRPDGTASKHDPAQSHKFINQTI